MSESSASTKAVCHHRLICDTERQTATDNIYMYLMVTGWPHLFFSKTYVQFVPVFSLCHGSEAPVFSPILNYINPRCRKEQSLYLPVFLWENEKSEISETTAILLHYCHSNKWSWSTVCNIYSHLYYSSSC